MKDLCTLSAGAARHCLSLGYNREAIVSSMPPQQSNRARRLFWHVYFIDKSLVLCLGRASTIQDFDVDLDPLPVSKDPGRRAWDEGLLLSLQFAKIQAQTYELLYSPASRKRTTIDR